MYALVYEKSDYDSSVFKVLAVSPSFEKLDEKINEYAVLSEKYQMDLEHYRNGKAQWEKSCKEQVRQYYNTNRQLLKEPHKPEGDWTQDGKPYSSFVKKTKQDIQINNLAENYHDIVYREGASLTKLTHSFPSLTKFDGKEPDEPPYNPNFLNITEVEYLE
jgi:hypothetical protein